MDLEPSSLGDEERAVVGFGPYGASPDRAVADGEAGDKVLVLAGGVTVLHGQANHFVAEAPGGPRGEAIALILRQGKAPPLLPFGPS